MIDYFFTLCSNNYLAQAHVLGNSLKQFHPESAFVIGLVDEKIDEIDYSRIPYEVLPVSSIEPKFEELLIKYDIIELNTCIKPRVFEFLFSRENVRSIVFLDPDIQVFQPMSELQTILENYSIVLTPHIYTPIPLDGKTPQESNFLNYGIYNLGFIAVKNTAINVQFIKWWKDTTYNFGFFRVKDGLFVDQLPINLVPVFFQGVHIMTHFGYNMAPWNLHERQLSILKGEYKVNEKENLVFYHFSGFKVNMNELPLNYYDRYKLKDRPDLQKLYSDYNQLLKEAEFEFFSKIRSVYSFKREFYLKEQEVKKYRDLPKRQKILIQISKKLPSWIKNRLYALSHQ